MRSGSHRARQTRPAADMLRPVPLAVLLLACGQGALALPQGGTVTSGKTTVTTPSTDLMVIRQSTNKAGMDWSSFSIGSSETVNVLQPGSSSVLVNRVTGADPSFILGRLNANGRIFLTNPRGIIFGKDSQVDVGGLVATTLSLADPLSTDGRYALTSGNSHAGSIVADGRISAPGGTVALVAPELRVTGSLDAHRVGLAAASSVTVDVEGDGLIFFNARNDGLDTRLSLLGSVRADGGTAELRAAARAGFADTVLNMDGVVQARALGTRDGKVVIDGGTSGIVSVTGTVDASGHGAGEHGGEVTVLGEKVGLFGNARVDAGGDAGGGTVLVGGGYQGGGPEHHAAQVIVGSGAQIDASAGSRGAGGEVVVWSDERTVFNGHIRAAGGANGGDGGRVETSSKGNLMLDGRVDTQAPKGKLGTWLLDPTDIFVVAPGGTTNLTLVDAFDDADLNSGTSRSNVNATAISNATSNVDLRATRDINFNAAVAIAQSGVGINAEAGGNITVNAGITTNGGAVTLSSNDPDSGAASAAGFVTVGANVNTGAGSLTITNNGGTGSHLLSGNLTTGTLSVSSPGGIRLNNPVTTVGDQSYTGPVRLLQNVVLTSSSLGDVSFSSTVDANTSGGQSLTVDTAGTVTFNGLVGLGTILDSLTVDGGGATTFDALGAGFSPTFSASVRTVNNQNYTGTLNAKQLTVLESTTGSVSISGPVTTGTNAALIVRPGGIASCDDIQGSLTQSVSTSFGCLNLTGSLTIAAGGNNLTFDTIDGAHALTVNTTGATSFAEQVGSATPLTQLTTNAGGTTTFNVVGAAAVSTTGAQSYRDDVVLSQDTTLSADATDVAGGAISFGGTINGAQALVVSTPDNTSFGGRVGNATTLTGVTVSNGATLFNAVGTVYPTTFAASVRTSGAQSYQDVTLQRLTVLESTGGAVTINGTLALGGFGLVVRQAGGSGCDDIQGSFSPSAATNTFGCLNLTGDVTINGVANALAFSDSVDGAHALTLNTTGATSFAEQVGSATPLTQLTTNAGGTTTFNVAGTAAVSTTGAQSYRDDVILSQDTTLSADATDVAGGAISFGGTINGAQALVVSTPDDTSFGGRVGNATTLTGVTVSNGATLFNAVGTVYPTTFAASVRTSGAQSYQDVTLQRLTVLESTGGAVTINGTLALGSFGLVVRQAGGSGCDDIQGSFSPSAATNTFGCLNLTGDVTINGVANALAFSDSVDGAHALTLNTTGATSFAEQVGAATPLTQLTTNAGGTTTFNAVGTAAVSTTGAQSYRDDVILSQDTTLSSDATDVAGGAISFGGTINGAQALVVSTPDDTSFGGRVGNATTLTGVTVSNGATLFNAVGTVYPTTFAASVRTSGAQSYQDVTLQRLTVLESTGGAVTINGTLALGGFGLVVRQAGGSGCDDIQGSFSPSAATNTFGCLNLTGDVTINGVANALAFSDSVDGAHALTLNTTGATSFAEQVGAATPLTQLTTNAGGTTTFNAVGTAAVSTTGAQTYGDDVILSQDTTLSSDATDVAGGAISFGGTINGAQALVVSTPDDTTFSGRVGGTTALSTLTTDGGGTSTFDVAGASPTTPTVTTSGAQVYERDGGAVVLVQDTTLTSGSDVSFGATGLATTVNGAVDLTVSAAGNTSFFGRVGDIAPLTQLTTNAGGTTTFNVVGAAAVSTTGAQTYGDDVVLSQDTTLSSDATDVAGGAISFGGTINGARALVVSTPDDTSFGGRVGDTTTLTGVTVSNGATLFNAVGTVYPTTFAASVRTSGAQSYQDVTLQRLTVLESTGGAVTINGTLALGGFGLVVRQAGGSGCDDIQGSFSPSAATNTFGCLNLTGDVTINGVANALAFSDSVDGAHALTLNTTGATSFAGQVGAATPLTQLTTNAGGTTTFNVVGTAAVSTTGAQTYGDDVILSQDTTLSSDATDVAGGAISFGGTINGAQALVVSTPDNTTFSGRVGDITPLTQLTTDAGGTTTLNVAGASPSTPTVTTTGTQVYEGGGGLVVLVQDTTLTSGSDVSFGSTGLATTVNGAVDLAVSATGSTSFFGRVGDTAALETLTTDAGGTTTFDVAGASPTTPTVTTSGAQVYERDGGAVVLAQNTTLTSGGDVSFGATGLATTLNGAVDLAVSAAGSTSFFGRVGDTGALDTLTTDAGGTTTFDVAGASPTTPTVTTSGAQVYERDGGAVVLAQNTTLTSGSDVSFGATGLATTVNGAVDLTVSATGNTSFFGRVGDIAALDTLTTDAGGTTTFDVVGASPSTPTVTTTGTQVYEGGGGLVVLAQDTTLTSGSDVSFGATGLATTVNGAVDLTVSAAGNTSFFGRVGDIAPLTQLTTNAGGTTTFNVVGAAAVSTTGAQTYGDDVVLSQDTTLSSDATDVAGGAISFGGTINGARALVVSTPDDTSFGGRVGDTTTLTGVTVSNGATLFNAVGTVYPTTFAASVRTSGAQSYQDVTLQRLTVLESTGGAVTINGTLALGGFGLVVRQAGGSGCDDIQGSFSPSAATNTFGCLNLTGDVTINGVANALAFSDSVDGAHALTLNTTGATSFAGQVGAATPLTQLTTNAGGTTTFNVVGTAAVSTTGAQTYGDDVVLSQDTTLSSDATDVAGGAISFGGTINGAQALVVSTPDNTTFSGRVGGTTALSTLTTDGGGTTTFDVAGASPTTPTVTTSGAQVYERDGGAVVLVQDTTLTSGSDVSFGATGLATTVNGAVDLTVSAAGNTSFFGRVGDIAALDTLTTDAGGTTTFDVAGASPTTPTVTTSGAQVYERDGGAVVLAQNTTLTSGGDVSFGATGLATTLNGAVDLAVSAAGNTSFFGRVGDTGALDTLTTDAGGTTTFDVAGASPTTPTVTTSGAQVYERDGGAVVLAQDTTLTSGSDVNFGATGLATTVNGPVHLTVSAAGNTSFFGRVGDTAALDTLTTDAGGTTTFDVAGASPTTPTVTTSAAQVYERDGGAVVLVQDTTLTSGSDVSFGATGLATTLNGAVDLAVSAAGNTSFFGRVGDTAALDTLTTGAGGTTTFDVAGASPTTPTVTTSGAQVYERDGGAVVLAQNTTLTSGSDVSFGATGLATTVNGAVDLTVSATGNTSFFGRVGDIAALDTLTTDAGGTTTFNVIGALPTVTTSGAQVYERDGGAVVLVQDTTLTSGSDVSFGATGLATTVNGPVHLTVSAAGNTSFFGRVGDTAALDTLTTDAGGTTTFNVAGASPTVATSGAQVYERDGGAVVLVQDTTLTSGSDVSFGATGLATTINGEVALTVSAAGNTSFFGRVGDTGALDTLTTDAGGTTTFDVAGASPTTPTVTTSAAQVYERDGGAVVLVQDTTLTSGSDVSFGSTGLATTVNGAVDLAVSANGNTSFFGRVGDTAVLDTVTTGAGGTTTFDVAGASPTTPTVTTSGAQVYERDGGAVVLAQNTKLTSGSDVSFGSTGLATTLNGAVDLTVSATGNTSFFGRVGDTGALDTLTTDAGGTTTFDVAGASPTVTTSGVQVYERDGGAVVLVQDTTLTSGSDVSFGATGLATTINGAVDLVVSAAGNTSFFGRVGDTAALDTLTTDAGGTTTFNVAGASPTVATSGAQVYERDGGAVVLVQDTTLTSGSDVSFGSTGLATTVNGAVDLTVSAAGTTSFFGRVGDTAALETLTTDAGGTTTFDVVGASPTTPTVTTSGAQVYERDGGAVVLVQDTTLSSDATDVAGGAISFGGTINGAQALVVSTPDDTTFSGRVGGTTALSTLTTDGGGTSTFDVAGASPTTPTVTTTGTQVYEGGGGLVVLVQDTTLTSGSDVSFGATGLATTVNGAVHLTVSAAGTTSFFGRVGDTAALDTLTTDAGGTTTFDVAGASPTTPTVTTSGAQSYERDGGAVVLAQNTTLTSDSDVGFGATGLATTINGAVDLAVSAAGNTSFFGRVGDTAALETLTTDAGGTTTFDVVGASPTTPTVTTSGAQVYERDGGAVVLVQDTTLTSGSDVSFGSTGLATTVNGAVDLAVSATGSTSFFGRVGDTAALETLTTDAGGTTTFDVAGASPTTPTVTTSAAQVYERDGGAVVLAQNTTLTSGSDVSFGLTGLATTLNGAVDLAVSATGNTSFFGRVGDTVALDTLTTDAGGTTTFNVAGALPTVTTSGVQVYERDGGAVVLVQDTTLTSGSDVSFGATGLATTINGAVDLAVSATGNTSFFGRLGDTTALIGLATDAGGTTTFNVVGASPTVTTSGAQVYERDGGAVVLVQDTTLTSGSDVSFGSTGLATTINGAVDLTVSAKGNTSFFGRVGDITPLTQLTTDAGGTTTFNVAGASPTTPTITTLGGQVYEGGGGLVVLAQNTTLTSGSDVSFGSTGLATTLNGAVDLAVSATGNTSFFGRLGDTTALIGLATDAGGTTTFNVVGASPTVTTSGAQVYERDGGAVVLVQDTTLTSGSDVSFGSTGLATTINGAVDLTVSAKGNTSFFGRVGDITPLTQLTTDAGGTTTFNVAGASPTTPTITTLGGQVYEGGGGLVVLAQNTTLTSGSDVSFGSTGLATTLNGAVDLAVSAAGNTSFFGRVGDTAALDTLTTDAGGTTTFNVAGASPTVATSGAQVYERDGGAVVLVQDTTLTSGSDVSFGSTGLATTVNGPMDLTVSAAGTTSFFGRVGDTAALDTLTTDAGGTTTFNVAGASPTVATSGAQVYERDGGAVVLVQDTTLTSGSNVSFGATKLAATINGAVALTVSAAGTTSFFGRVGDTTALASLTTNGGGITRLDWIAPTATPPSAGLATVTTLGSQNYEDALKTGQALFLKAGGTITATNPDNEFGNRVGLDAGSVNLVSLLDGTLDVGDVTLAGTVSDAPASSIEGNAVLVNGAFTLNGGSASVTARQDLTLNGPVSVQTGSLDLIAEGSLALNGDVTVPSGMVTMEARGTAVADPDALARVIADAAHSALLTSNTIMDSSGTRYTIARNTVTQAGTSTITVATNGQLNIKTRGGSVELMSPDNSFAGGLSIVAAPISPPSSNDANSPPAIKSLVQVQGASKVEDGVELSSINVNGAGIEADLVRITADKLQTIGDAAITARLVYSSQSDFEYQLPAMTLNLGDANFVGGGRPFGGERVPIHVEIGVGSGPGFGGYMTVRPKSTVDLSLTQAFLQDGAVIFLAGPESSANQYLFFYDGAGNEAEIPVYYNGFSPNSPQVESAIGSALSLAEVARRDRFEETVRTENVASRIRTGVIAEVGPAGPAMQGFGGAALPVKCEPVSGGLSCSKKDDAGKASGAGVQRKLHGDAVGQVGPARAATQGTPTPK